MARVVILGPIERYKIIMQVDHLAKYANANDRPKNFGDLHSKVVLNQGSIALYRGYAANVYKLSIQSVLRFVVYENLLRFNGPVDSKGDPQFSAKFAAALTTGILSTTITYPLDMAQGRMCADMSKKPSMFLNINSK